MKKWVMSFAATAALSISTSAATPAFDPGPYLSAQRLIDIGGRRLNIYCAGNGSPTVVFDSGLGGSTADWALVQGAIARKTRACAYDRAGMGFSDAATSPRTADAEVGDLHSLLTHAHIAPPYVLVGHSIAGLYDRVYVDRHPREVAGMVLVDPGFPYQIQQQAKVSSRYARFFASQGELFEKCARAAAAHKLTAGTPLFKQCGLLNPNDLRKQCEKDGLALCKIDVLQNDQARSPALWEAIASEFSAFSTVSSNQVTKEQRDYGRMPLAVLTRGKTGFRSPRTGITKGEDRALWREWKLEHDRIAELSSIGTDNVVANAGHYIQIDRPAAVIAAVDKVVDEVRSLQR